MRLRSIRLIIIGVLVLMTAGAGPAELVRRVALGYDLSGHSRAKWEHGTFITFKPPSTVVAIDTRNEFEAARTIQLAIPDIVRFQITDVAVSPSGGLAVSGTATALDGSAAASIVFLPADGQLQRVVRTAPFAPWAIVFANDGSLWAAGSEHDAQYKDSAGV